MSSEIRRTMPLLPISIVMQLTDLTARQIRYYEEHDLIQPHRTEGNRRMFSLNDVDTLLEIKDMLEQGVNMAGIKKVFAMKQRQKKLLMANYVKFCVKKCVKHNACKKRHYVKGIYHAFTSKCV